MTHERVDWLRYAALSTALFISGAVTAQVVTPRVLPEPGTFVPPPGITSIEVANPADFARRVEEQRQALRDQLADPEQRAQLLGDRIERLRASSPDFGRVLALDAETEAKLLTLLVDQELSDEFRPNPFANVPRTVQDMNASSASLVQQEALQYDQHLLEIRKLIGAKPLDRYIEYVRTRAARLQVARLDRQLPDAFKLSNAQKDAAVPIFAADAARRAQRSLAQAPPLAAIAGGNRFVAPFPGADTNERMQRYNLHITEEQAQITEAENRTLLAQLSKVLSPEQAEAYSPQQAEDVQRIRLRAQGMRRDLGLGSDEQLSGYEIDKPLPVVLGNLELTIRVRVNGSEVTKTATSKRGRALTFNGPAGLWVEAQPSLSGPATVKIELKVYETIGGSRRLIGESSSYQWLGASPRQRAVVNGGGGQSLLRGRKAYLMDWSAAARPS